MYIKNKKSDIDTLYLHALGMLHLLWHRRPIKLYRFEAAAARRSTEMGLLVEAITHHRLKPNPSIFFLGGGGRCSLIIPPQPDRGKEPPLWVVHVGGAANSFFFYRRRLQE